MGVGWFGLGWVAMNGEVVNARRPWLAWPSAARCQLAVGPLTETSTYGSVNALFAQTRNDGHGMNSCFKNSAQH